MRVLISGTGIAGPTLAWFLAKAGARVSVLEKSPDLLTQGQNIDIQGSARAVIDKMGLLDHIKRMNTTETGTQFIDPKGRPFAPFPVKEGIGASFTNEYEILRGDLAQILYDASKDHPNVDYTFGTTIEEVVSNDDESVRVKLSNGEVKSFDLLVAADGQWSRVRKSCFPQDSVEVVDKDMYVAYFTIPRTENDNEWWNVYHALGSRIITTRPDPHGTIRAMFTSMPCNAAQKEAWQQASRSGRQAQHELLRKEFSDAGWQAHRLLHEMEKSSDFYFQAVQQIKMKKWYESRVVCLGDAAYAPTPLTGMGTSLAIMGAYVLSGELSKLKDGEHPMKALEAYEGAFRKFVEETQKVPSIFPGIAHPETAWQRWLFQSGISTLSWIASMSWLMNRFAGSQDEDFVLPQYESFGKVALT